MKHMEFNPTGLATKQDYRVLGNALMRSSNKFDISSFQNRNVSPSQFECNEETELCAVGFACAIGIGNPEDYHVNDSITGLSKFQSGGWNDYSYKIFGVKKMGDISDIGNMIGLWVAHEGWSRVDNTARGAGKRVLYMLENGIPDIHSIQNMMSGQMDLCYSDVGESNDKRRKIDISDFINMDDMVKGNPELALV